MLNELSINFISILPLMCTVSSSTSFDYRCMGKSSESFESHLFQTLLRLLFPTTLWSPVNNCTHALSMHKSTHALFLHKFMYALPMHRYIHALTMCSSMHATPCILCQYTSPHMVYQHTSPPMFYQRQVHT